MAPLPAEDDPNRLSPRDRYLRDPEFHALVSFLAREVERGNYTPTELREACILAATIVESRRPMPPIQIAPDHVGDMLSNPDTRRNR